ncbi:MAG TPA: alpha/beta hydrolase [Polyangiaceae bacterium]
MNLIWQDTGSGSDVVVLLHPSGVGPAGFGSLPERLAATRRVLVPWMPGYGPAAAMAPCTAASLDEQLTSDLAALGVRRASLLGYSIGGYRALRLALSGGLDVPRVLCLAGFAELSSAEKEGLVGAGAALANPGVLRAIATTFLAPAYAASHPAAIDGIQGWLEAMPVEGIAAELRSLADLESVLARVGKLGDRLRLRSGDADLSVPVSHSRDLHAAAPGSELAVVAGAGHALFVEDERDTLAWIERALSGA